MSTGSIVNKNSRKISNLEKELERLQQTVSDAIQERRQLEKKIEL